MYTANFTSAIPQFELNLKIIRNEINSSQTTISLQIYLEDVTDDISIEKSRGDILVQEEGGSDRILTIFLPVGIPSGTQLMLKFKGALLPLASAEIDHGISSSTEFKLFAMTALLPAGTKIIGMSPTAHEQNSYTSYDEYKWNYVNKKFASINIQYIPPFSIKDIHVKWTEKANSVYQGRSGDFSILVRNDAQRSVQIAVIVPKWFTLLRDGSNTGERKATYVINAGSNLTIGFRARYDLKPGKFSGNVYVTYQDSIVDTLEIEFEVLRTGLIQFLIAVISTIALIALGVYSLYRKKNIQKGDSIEKEMADIEREIADIKTKNYTETKPVITSTASFAKTSRRELDYTTLERLMDPRDVTIIEYIHHNEGTSQQSISSDLGISKATISRILKRLENKEIIRKKQNGMTNKIYLDTKKIPHK